MTITEQQIITKAYQLFGSDRTNNKLELIKDRIEGIKEEEYTDQMVRDLLSNIVYE